MSSNAVLEFTAAPMTDAAPIVQPAAPTDAGAWSRFVADQPDATGYHQWGWRTVVERAFGHECIYLTARTPAGEIVGILPLVFINSRIFGRSLTSLPFLNYAGVLARNETVGRALLSAAADAARARGCGHVELRHVARQFSDLPCRQHKVTMLLQLEQNMWDRLDRKVRNQIRKAQKSGLTSERGRQELLPDFYTVFARNMRDLGTPVYARRLFEEVLAAFPEQAHLHVVRLEGKPVAAGVTFQHGVAVEVPWASSIRDYNNLCPNHLLYWSVIESACALNLGILDFGRSTPQEGTYKFKEQWGAQPVPLHWEYAMLNGGEPPNVGPANPKYRMAIEAWKKLPLPIACALGPHIVRAIP